MTNDSTPESELASAAFDNEVLADERERVMASPELSAELRGYEVIRDQLRGVTPPADVRDAAISAALAVFDALPATATAMAPAAIVVSLDRVRLRRQRQYRVLGAVAAVAVLAVGGAALFGSRNSDSKNSASEAAASSKALPQPEQLPSAAAQTGTILSSDVAAATDAPADTAAAAAVSGGITEINAPAQVSPWAAAPTIADADQLAQFVASAQYTTAVNLAGANDATADSLRIDATAGAGPVGFACAQDIAAPAVAVIYLDKEVVVVYDEPGKQIHVIDPVNCAVTLVAVP